MAYHQITPEESYTLATLRKQTPTLSHSAMAHLLCRHRSTITREFRRDCARFDGAYRPSKAQERTKGRRARSRRNGRISKHDWNVIELLLRQLLSPEQISGRLRKDGVLEVSHETIYKYIWKDKKEGGHLWLLLRQRLRYRKRSADTKNAGESAASATSLSDNQPWSSEAKSVTGRWTRSSAPAISTAWSAWSSARPAAFYLASCDRERQHL